MCRKRVQRTAIVPQNLHARPDDEGNRTKRFPELEPVVTLAWLVELREALRVFPPVEFPRVDDDAADCGAVAADPFGGRMHDDVGAVLDGAHKVAAGAKSVVYDDGDAGFVGDGGDLFKVGDVVFGVADGFEVYGFCVFVNGGFEVFGLVAVYELGLDAEAGECDFELVVCAAVPEYINLVYRGVWT